MNIIELDFQLIDGYWVYTYSGPSGALQILFDTDSSIEILGDAGLNTTYDLPNKVFAKLNTDVDGCRFKSRHLLKYINMTGLSEIKIVCSSKPKYAIINQQ